MLNRELIKKTEEFLKETFENATDFEQDDLPYRIEHSYRVANIGREIALKEGFDETEMVIACLLHDIAYYEADGENRFWPAHREHGRRSAQIARPFLEGLGLPQERINDICYGIAIHVDDEADFEGERTAFAVTIGDADNIDRFDAFRLHETMSRDGFLEKPYEEQVEYVEKRLVRLHGYREMPTATKTADEMWKSRIDFYIAFFEKLANQLKQSKSVTD
jgi:uncharacterized protein